LIRPLDDLPAAFRLLGPSPRPSSPQLAEEELSEEDQKLKEDLELMVTRAADEDAGVQKLAIESLGNEIRCGGGFGFEEREVMG
jgi:hypothetical protein